MLALVNNSPFVTHSRGEREQETPCQSRQLELSTEAIIISMVVILREKKLAVVADQSIMHKEQHSGAVRDTLKSRRLISSWNFVSGENRIKIFADKSKKIFWGI